MKGDAHFGTTRIGTCRRLEMGAGCSSILALDDGGGAATEGAAVEAAAAGEAVAGEAAAVGCQRLRNSAACARGVDDATAVATPRDHDDLTLLSSRPLLVVVLPSPPPTLPLVEVAVAAASVSVARLVNDLRNAAKRFAFVVGVPRPS